MNSSDIIMALDPGSLRTGWAVLRYDERLIEAGTLTPDNSRLVSYLRIGRMCEDLLQLLAEWEPGTVVIEWTSGKVGKRRHKGQGAGLGVHGASVGALWQAAEAWRRSLEAEQQSETAIILIEENTWTNGIVKQDRLAGIASVFPEYDSSKDATGDIGDSIGLALYHIKERRLRTAQHEARESIRMNSL